MRTVPLSIDSTDIHGAVPLTPGVKMTAEPLVPEAGYMHPLKVRPSIVLNSMSVWAGAIMVKASAEI